MGLPAFRPGAAGGEREHGGVRGPDPEGGPQVVGGRAGDGVRAAGRVQVTPGAGPERDCRTGVPLPAASCAAAGRTRGRCVLAVHFPV